MVSSEILVSQHKTSIPRQSEPVQSNPLPVVTAGTLGRRAGQAVNSCLEALVSGL